MTISNDWPREIGWRQGDVLTASAAQSFSLCDADNVVVVISHDCDIAQSANDEPNLEAIIGKLVSTADGNCLHAKNARCLHLVESASSAVIELRATRKVLIPKSAVKLGRPDTSKILSASSRRTLQRWLTHRYQRAALPDKFNEALRASGIGDRLQKILKQCGSHVLAVYFTLDEADAPTASDRFSLYLVYDTAIDPRAAEKAVMKAKSDIVAGFKERCLREGKWEGIELVECVAIAETVFSLSDARHSSALNLDHLSLREDGHPLASRM